VDRSTGYRTKSILCVPVVDDQDRVLAVVQAINKRSASLSSMTRPKKRKPKAPRRSVNAGSDTSTPMDDLQHTPRQSSEYGDDSDSMYPDLTAPTPLPAAFTPTPVRRIGKRPFDSPLSMERSSSVEVSPRLESDPNKLRFSTEDERLLAAVCAAAAEALQKARLLSEH